MVDNKYGIEPEEYADLEENYPELYKNTDSGTSTVPTGNPFDGGGDGNCDIRTITLVNNREGSSNSCTMYRLQDQDGTKRMFSQATLGGQTGVYEVVAPRYYSSSNDYNKQWLVIKTKSAQTEPVIDTAVATTIGHIVSGSDRYTIIETVRGSKDITITVS